MITGLIIRHWTQNGLDPKNGISSIKYFENLPGYIGLAQYYELTKIIAKESFSVA
jgi:hypothetical protein